MGAQDANEKNFVVGDRDWGDTSGLVLSTNFSQRGCAG
jgi:hypothetical protein